MLQIDQARFCSLELERPRHADPLRLTRYGAKAYSQSDEDGIITEIFRRIGSASRSFLEIGVGNGFECNSLWLLMQGWKGTWVEANPEQCALIRSSHRAWLETDALRLIHQQVTADSIDALASGSAGKREIDLLSIGIDYNDYWVWEALEAVRPRAVVIEYRAVVIEYNAAWPPPAAVTVPYDAAARWNGGNYFGASLAALASLGRRKGYSLVGCNLAGVNAFFVRQDLVEDRFLNPGSVEDHYKPPRYFLSALMGGHPPAIGPLVCIE